MRGGGTAAGLAVVAVRLFALIPRQVIRPRRGRLPERGRNTLLHLAKVFARGVEDVNEMTLG